MNTIASFLAAAAISVFGGASSTPPTMPTTSCTTLTKQLQVGSRGEEVKRLQQVLGVEQTGYFGALTRQKLIDWQIAKKIVANAKTAGAGTTGPKTRAALKCTTASSVPAAAGPTTTPVIKSVATSTPPTEAPANLPAPAGGGGGVSVPSLSPYGYACAALGVKPQSACDGSWQVSADEAGCVIWACLSTDERG